MKYLANILICCLLTATLCGCQTAKTPATLSSTPSAISKEDIASATEEETSTHISNITDSSVASEETNTSVSETTNSSLASSLNTSTSDSSSNASSFASSVVSILPNVSATTETSSTTVTPLHDFDNFDREEPYTSFFNWAKANRYNDGANWRVEFLRWAKSQRGILMPNVNNDFDLGYIDIYDEVVLHYTFWYYTRNEKYNEEYDGMRLSLFPLDNNDTDVTSLPKLIKKHNLRAITKEGKYKKGSSKCKWGTYYIETSYYDTIWFRYDNYLISCEYGLEFNNEVFDLIDFEIKEFEDGFYTEQDFVDWVKTNRKTSKISDFGYSLLNSLKSKSEIMLPNIALDGFSLKEVYPITHQNIYKAVFTSAKPVNGIESIEFEIQSFQNTSKRNTVSLVDNDYPEEKSLSKSKRSYEYVESETLEDKCNYGFYVKAKKQPVAYFSHKDFAVKITVNLKEKSGGFKEEYFDLFDIEYISLD